VSSGTTAGPEGPAPTAAERFAVYQRAGGIVTPLLTAVFAFFMAGIVVLATGHNPLRTYKEILDGAGLNWFFHFGSYHIDLPFTDTHVWFWWNTDTNDIATYNLTQTLLITGPIILTGLAVAFAFRCGLFNIGGQGQYIVGAIVAVYVGSRFVGLGQVPHVLLAMALAGLAGAAWAGIAGALKAGIGAHEVITTIMLNWIAYWGGIYLVGRGGPLQNHADRSLPFSDSIADSAHLPIIWGTRVLQGLHAGIFVALVALVIYAIVLNRTTLGYEVRAVGFNPEAARYGGISVARNVVVAMLISGVFAGLAGSLDILGWQNRISTDDIKVSSIGFIGIAVALLGRNTALGVGLAGFLFGALMNGTSPRSLSDPTVFPPELADSLAVMIQALVLIFIGADVLILYLWHARRKLSMPRLIRTARESA
jgi:simple sugar transport system permease protein